MKRFLGILVIIFGGIVMQISLVSGTIMVAAGMYEDIYTTDLLIMPAAKEKETPVFEIKQKKNISVWIKAPDRQIENKNSRFEGAVMDAEGRIVSKLGEDFSLGYSRNSSGHGQYYSLGKFDPVDNFTGSIRYMVSGKWVPPYDLKLIVRKSEPFYWPYKQMGFLVLGIIFLVWGIAIVRK